MKYWSKMLFVFLFVLSFVIAKDLQIEKKMQNSIIYNSEIYNINDVPNHQNSEQSREQINLILEDFESTAGDWDPSDGWETNTTEFQHTVGLFHFLVQHD